MKWIRLCSAIVAMFSLTTAAQAAGLFGHHGSSKGCGCAEQPSCCAPTKPECCAPTIQRPCATKVYQYQRQLSCLKPPCCNKGCAPASCCAPAAKACCPSAPVCAAPAGCVPAQPACGNQPCCAPKKKCSLLDCFKGSGGLLGGCHKRGCGESACGEGCAKQRVCDADPCEIAELIYASQTACQPKDRKKAVDELGEFDCVCNPEVLCALVYALNDADPGVRTEAADEIGDMLEDNRCCCKPEVVAALTCSLADCDRHVRCQAEQALEACGYKVVDGCCGKQGCCTTSACGVNGCAPAAPATTVPATVPGHVPAAPAPAPEADGDDAPAPPANLQTKYFPSRLRQTAGR